MGKIDEAQVAQRGEEGRGNGAYEVVGRQRERLQSGESTGNTVDPRVTRTVAAQAVPHVVCSTWIADPPVGADRPPLAVCGGKKIFESLVLLGPEDAEWRRPVKVGGGGSWRKFKFDRP